MSKYRYHCFSVLTIVVIVVLNALTGYINISSQEYVSYGSVSIKRSMLNKADEILSAYDYSEYP